MSAAVSTANCMANIRLRRLQLSVISPATVDAIDHAMQPSLSLLEAVIHTGDLKWQIIALHARADILAGAAHRFIAINPQHPYAKALAEPWLAKADRTHRRLIAVARTAPREVLAHPVVRFAIIDSGRAHQTIARR